MSTESGTCIEAVGRLKKSSTAMRIDEVNVYKRKTRNVHSVVYIINQSRKQNFNLNPDPVALTAPITRKKRKEARHGTSDINNREIPPLLAFVHITQAINPSAYSSISKPNASSQRQDGHECEQP